jgi:nitroreductase
MKVTEIDVRKHRTPEYPVGDQMLQRWSPRAFAETELTREELMSLFEAARWAPSCFNSQPWRFFYVRRGERHWNAVCDLMIEFNRQWASKAAALLIIFSRKTFELNNKPSRTHSFDSGAAWENLNLQALAQGLIVHGMAGFDYDRAHQFLNLPEDYQVEAMAAVGWPGDVSELPAEMQEREVPSGRKPLKEIVLTEPLAD